MPFYEAGGLTTAPAATADKMYCQLWNGSADRIRLREAGFTNTAATGCKIAVKRTSARGTNTTTVVGASLDTGETTTGGTFDLTYSADPTVTGVYLRRAHLAAVIGAGVMWTWWNGSGLVIPASAGVAFVVPTAVVGVAQEAWVVFEQ